MEIAQNNGRATPITVLTGFLGAGKTTLLNRILNGTHGLRVGVLVNDFGSLNIDAELVVGVEDNQISLANGCVCCQIRDDLIESVNDLLTRPEPIEYIILEASGVADPAGIALTFSDPNLRDRIRLDSVTCVVDAEQVFAQPELTDLLELKMRQIVFADMVILNKVDLAGQEQVDKVKAWIDSLIRRIRIVEASHCDVPYEILLGVGRFDLARTIAEGCSQPGSCEEHEHGQLHSEVFNTWSYETDKPLSLEALRETARKLPGSVYRCKGVVYAAEEPDWRVVLQVVGRRADVSLLDEWNDRTPRTQIVAIGAAGAVDAEILQQKFDECIVTERRLQ